MFLKYFLAWFPLVVIAIINGSIRQFGYSQYVTELSAHQISTFTGIVLFGIYIWLITRVWKINSAKQAFAIGGMWLGMTILFEFGFGHYVMGHPWSKLLHDYNLFAGRLWIFILIWTATAPYVFYKFNRKNN